MPNPNKEAHDSQIIHKDQNSRFAVIKEHEKVLQKHIAGQIAFDEGVEPNEIAIFYRVNSMSRSLEEALIRSQVPYQVVRGVEFYNRKEIRDMLSYLKLIANPADDVAFLRAVGTHSRGIGKTTVERLASYARINGIGLLAAARRVRVFQ